MALSSSGPIAMSQINTELGRSSASAISLGSAEDGGYAAINSCAPIRPSSANPAAMSEWRGYNHTFACCNAPSISAGNTATNSLGVAISYSNCSTMHIEYSSNYGSSWSTNTGGCTSYATISSLASGTTYLIRVRITCTSTGGYSGYSNTISMSTGAACAAYGTYITSFCSGCTYYDRYADGSCGSYDVNRGCTTGCGGCCCSPGYGTYLYDGCNGCDYYYYYSDGCNGTYSSLQGSNSPNCGCGGGLQCYSYYSDGGGWWEGLDCTGRPVSGYAYYYGQSLGCLQEIYYGGYQQGEVCGDPNCPTPDMPILIAPNTWVMAGELQVGDYVYTKHQATGEWGSYQVSKVQPGTNIVSSTIIGGKEIKVSSNHRFLTESMGFVPLSELWVGAKVQTIDGLAEIESIEEIGELPVIQIEVEDAHTYVIMDVLSHNRKLEPI